jgi:hypothetical protein
MLAILAGHEPATAALVQIGTADLNRPPDPHRSTPQTPQRGAIDTHPPQRRSQSIALSSPQISTRRAQIPIERAAPPHLPPSRFPPLEAFGCRPPEFVALSGAAGIRNPSQTETHHEIGAAAALPQLADIAEEGRSGRVDGTRGIRLARRAAARRTPRAFVIRASPSQSRTSPIACMTVRLETTRAPVEEPSRC